MLVFLAAFLLSIGVMNAVVPVLIIIVLIGAAAGLYVRASASSISSGSARSWA